LRSFFTPKYFFGGRGEWSIGNKIFVVFKCVFIEKLLYTQILIGFCPVFNLGGWENRVGFRGFDIKYLLYINVYSLRNVYALN
jgi:hypothetical protein